MTIKPLLLLAIALVPAGAASLGAQDIPLSGERVSARAQILPGVDSVADAALAAAMARAQNGLASQRAPAEHRRWVRTAKWSLLAAAAGFGAYALANSRTERTDRRAQIGILGGQLSLLGSVGLFIYDLRPHHETPENIPFEQNVPATDAGGSGARDQP